MVDSEIPIPVSESSRDILAIRPSVTGLPVSCSRLIA